MNASEKSLWQTNAFIPALAFIVIGGILLLRNLDVLDIGHNWWAFFFLIPIAYSVANFRRYRQMSPGKFSAEMRNTLLGLLSMSFIMCVFLFNWNWGAIWPTFLILGGLSILLSSKLD